MKPAWLNKKISLKDCSAMKKVATFLILGKSCTRNCSFCNIQKARPLPPEADEPERVAQAIGLLGLAHVVITSVTRDDLADGGSSIFADTVNLIRQRFPRVSVEILIPDFGFSLAALKTVALSAPQIIAHNLETVPALYKTVRQGADYAGSLGLLRRLKEIAPQVKTKSGLMLGLGEKKDEVLEVMRDLRCVGCDLLSIGQYLAPSAKHYPVKDYISPEQFADYGKRAKQLGFSHIESGPYVRSSYLAADYLS
jgi:lipoic acid synthetase